MHSLESIVLGVLLPLVIAWIAHYKQLLDRSGSVAAFVLGTIVFSVSGVLGSVLLIWFFISSSLLGKLPKPTDAITTEEKHGRNWIQVTVNGLGPLVSCILLLLTPQYQRPLSFLFYTSLAVATADTWATELGTRYGGVPINIVRFTKMTKGLSGGVSLVGIISSIVGSTTIALLASGLLKDAIATRSFLHPLVSLQDILIVSLAGLIGSLVDSLLGAILQAKYQCVKCSKIVEVSIHCNTPTHFVAGRKAISNNTVNLLSAFLVGLAVMIAVS